MKITLDLEELADILSKHLGTPVNSGNMIFHNDPVLVTISDVPLTKLPNAAQTKPPARESVKEAPFRSQAEEAPAPENDEFSDETSNSVLTMEDILNLNRAATRDRGILSHPEVQRVLGPNESYGFPGSPER